MAQAETNIVNTIMMDVSKDGARVFRNVRGGFYPIAAIKPIIAAIMAKNLSILLALVKTLRPLQAGLVIPGASDLIGFTPVIITQEMVGQKIAVFTAIEVKTDTGVVSPDQEKFIRVVLENGGYSGVARNSEMAKKIIKK